MHVAVGQPLTVCWHVSTGGGQSAVESVPSRGRQSAPSSAVFGLRERDREPTQSLDDNKASAKHKAKNSAGTGGGQSATSISSRGKVTQSSSTQSEHSYDNQLIEINREPKDS